MYKLILHDYFYHFKTGLKNFYTMDNWFFYIYALVCLPMMNRESMEELQYFFGMLPMLLSLLLSRMYGGQMGKTFFLCPLSKEQRTQYIRESMFLRIGSTTGLFLILNLILIAIRQLTWFEFLSAFFVMILYNISVNIYCRPIAIHKKTNQKWYPFLGNYELWNALAQIIGMLNMLLFSTYEGTEKPWEYIIMSIFLLTQLIITIVIVKKFYHQVIRQVTFYDVLEINDNDIFKQRNFYHSTQE